MVKVADRTLVLVFGSYVGKRGHGTDTAYLCKSAPQEK